MPREKFQTLTEQMFYILLCLQNECCGTDIMEKVKTMTSGRVQIGPGTLYNLLESFLKADLIAETKVEGRKRSYQITAAGQAALEAECRRLSTLLRDYNRWVLSMNGPDADQASCQTSHQTSHQAPHQTSHQMAHPSSQPWQTSCETAFSAESVIQAASKKESQESKISERSKDLKVLKESEGGFKNEEDDQSERKPDSRENHETHGEPAAL